MGPKKCDFSVDKVNDLIEAKLAAERVIWAAEVGKLKREIEKLKSEHELSELYAQHLARRIDDNNQYSRKVNLIIDGLDVKRGDSDRQIRKLVIAEIRKLKLDILDREVDRAHRHARAFKDRNGRWHTPVIARFTSWNARNEFYSNRMKLANIYVSADLTELRSNNLMEAKSRVSTPNSRESKLIEAVFADRNCHVTLKSVDGRYLKFNSMIEFDRLVEFIDDTKPPYEAIWKALERDDRACRVVIGGVTHLHGMTATDAEQWMKNPAHVYVGEASEGFVRSPWAAPAATIDGVAAAQYEEHVTSSDTLSAQLGSLRGKALGCCCEMEICHASILSKLANGEQQ